MTSCIWRALYHYLLRKQVISDFTVIFKSATHISSQGGISAALRRPNIGQTGYITNFKLHCYKSHVSMTIVSSTGAVASVIKTSLQCTESDLLLVLQLGEFPVSPSSTCQASGKRTNRTAQDN